MRRILVLIFMSIVAVELWAFEDPGIEFEIPDGFSIDSVSETQFIVSKDSARAYIEYLHVPDISREKALALSDSDFINLKGFELLAGHIDGDADLINKYYNSKENRYIKFYRHIHNDGMTYIYAINDTDNFSWSDVIDRSYHKGLRWYWIALNIVLIILWGISTLFACGYFGKNWPRFIVCFLISMIFFICAILYLSFSTALIILALCTVIGIANRMGYVIVPI